MNVTVKGPNFAWPPHDSVLGLCPSSFLFLHHPLLDAMPHPLRLPCFLRSLSRMLGCNG